MEHSPLVGGSRSSRLGLIVGVLAFVLVFLAFVLSAATLARVNKMEPGNSSQTHNNYNPTFGAVGSYKVGGNGHSVRKGQVVSFVDNEGEIAAGLGPQWDGEAAFIHQSGWAASSSASASISAYNGAASVYAYTALTSENVLGIVNVLTPEGGNMTVASGLNYTLPATSGTITSVHVKTLDPSAFAVIFSTYLYANNVSTHTVWMITGKSTNQFQGLQINLPPTRLNVPYESWNLTMEMQVLRNEAPNTDQAWLMLAFAPIDNYCAVQWWALDYNQPNFLSAIVPTTSLEFFCAPPVRIRYLQNGYFVFANAWKITLGRVDWVGSVANVSESHYGYHAYETLDVTYISDPNQNLIVLAGIQLEGTGGNMIISQVVEWKALTLNVHHAIALVPNLRFNVYHNHIRSCYIQPNAWHPRGVLLYSYVDDYGIPSLLRAKINQYQNQYYWVLSSPRISASHVPYVSRNRDPSTHPSRWWQEPESPLLECPPGSTRSVLVLQSMYTSMNQFFWTGGYRLAGIAQTDANSGANVQVTRAGAVNLPNMYNGVGLQTGFTYLSKPTTTSFHPYLLLCAQLHGCLPSP
eukprot:TRINITY_DN1071_c0_g1_i1.p1 TRINITY_DN1071_c0_g1~~TRINITY_DN1071_c0_g1_i1.p1  ORF type:complete len:579 (-),score=123.92 TRINITY_DN1071_c0_g1_i1:882-2618(-)